MEEERVEGAEGAAVVGEPEKCNTVTFVGADGMEQSFRWTSCWNAAPSWPIA